MFASAGHRHHADGRHALPPGGGGLAPADHAAARRRRRGVLRAAPAGARRRPRRCPARSAHVWYEQRRATATPARSRCTPGSMNLDDVKLPDDAGYYLCGPLPFMQAVRSALIDRGVAAARHPVRGVRPRPLAGRPRHRGDPRRARRGLAAAPPPSTVRPAAPTAGRTPTPEETLVDIPAMRANFAKAAATGDEAPLYFYSHLFLSHPETRAMFPVSMAHQRDRLFAALGDVVARVDDLDALVPILQQLGRDHRKFGTRRRALPGGRRQPAGDAGALRRRVDAGARQGAGPRPTRRRRGDDRGGRRGRRSSRPGGRPTSSATSAAPSTSPSCRCARAPATTTRPGSRSRWRPTCGRGCGATTPPPTPRGPTA